MAKHYARKVSEHQMQSSMSRNYFQHFNHQWRITHFIDASGRTLCRTWYILREHYACAYKVSGLIDEGGGGWLCGCWWCGSCGKWGGPCGKCGGWGITCCCCCARFCCCCWSFCCFDCLMGLLLSSRLTCVFIWAERLFTLLKTLKWCLVKFKSSKI